MWRIVMKYIKIHWIHNFKDDPEFIYSAIDESGYEIKKVEIFKNGDCIIYSENINSDRLAEGMYPLLEELNFKEEFESMQTIEISETEFTEIWDKYNKETR
jgi:coenzyme F420-reducing hydrogenase delta subunit